MDDRTAGLTLRALRRRLGWTQAELGARCGISQSAVSRAERGHFDAMAWERVRRLFAAVDARVQLAPTWRGAALERLLDEAHAGLVARAGDVLAASGWDVDVEVTYSRFGERGSIDVLGIRRDRLAAFVGEVKGDMPSTELAGRKLDEKWRLAPQIVFERHGWRPTVVGRAVIFPDEMRLRRAVERHAGSFGRMLPDTSRDARRWLRDPTGPLSAVWFLSEPSHSPG